MRRCDVCRKSSRPVTGVGELGWNHERGPDGRMMVRSKLDDIEDVCQPCKVIVQTARKQAGELIEESKQGILRAVTRAAIDVIRLDSPEE